MKKLIFILILLMTGCGPFDRILVEEEFTAKEFEVMKEVIDDMVIATDSEEFHISIAGEFFDDNMSLSNWIESRDVGKVWKVTKNESEVVTDFMDGDEFKGITSHTYGSMAIVKDNIHTPLEFRRVFTHEIIHYIIGSKHLDNGVMTSSYSGYYCIDEQSLRELCKARECGPNAASNCQLYIDPASNGRMMLPERLMNDRHLFLEDVKPMLK